MDGEVQFSLAEGVAEVVLNRPHKLNAITPAMDRELARLFTELAHEESCRVVLLRGNGERAFSAGADTSDTSFPEGFRVGDDWDPARGAQAAQSLISYRKPLIAAVHGYCLGGAAELILHADFRIAAEGTTISFPEAELGMTPGWGASQLLPRIASRAVALDLLMTGRRIDGREAERLGIVTRVVADGELLDAARELAKTLSSRSPVTLRLIKQAVSRSAHLPLADGIGLERDYIAYRFAERKARA